MERYDWRRLNHLQIGRYAEYLVKMEFTLYGFDVYTSEVDDKGIDFVVRRDCNRYLDVQVKSVRGRNYVFLPKDKFDCSQPNLLLALAVLDQSESAKLLLIPACEWTTAQVGDSPLAGILVGRDYPGLKSKPEWGINLSQMSLPVLQERFRFDLQISRL